MLPPRKGGKSQGLKKKKNGASSISYIWAAPATCLLQLLPTTSQTGHIGQQLSRARERPKAFQAHGLAIRILREETSAG